MRFELTGRTDIGKIRKSNQDRFVARFLEGNAALAAVADGLGGEAGGEEAAVAAVSVLEGVTEIPVIDPEVFLPALVDRMNREIADIVGINPELEGMGTTLTAILAFDHAASWVHVGDSRLYLARDGMLQQITTDHTFIQDLIEDGVIGDETARTHPMRNLLAQCVGCAECRPDTGRFRLETGDILLLCSDGLYDGLTREDLSRVLFADTDLAAKADALIDEALAAGGRDNVTVVLLRATATAP